MAVEQAVSLEAAADRLRPEVDLPGAIRWTRRRVQRIHGTLTLLRGLDPVRFALPARLDVWRLHLDAAPVLPALREMTANYLQKLPAPLGLRPVADRGGESHQGFQHPMGPDPPSRLR